MKKIFQEEQVIGTWVYRNYYPASESKYSYRRERYDPAEEEKWGTKRIDVVAGVTACWDAGQGVLRVLANLISPDEDYRDAGTGKYCGEWIMDVIEETELLASGVNGHAAAIRRAITYANTHYEMVRAAIPAPDKRSDEEVKAQYYLDLSREEQFSN